MASIVIPWIMCAAIRERRRNVCTRTLHAQEEQCNACAVEYTVLGQEKKKRDDLHHDLQDHGVGHYTRWPAS